MDSLLDKSIGTQERPQLLKILCILSFVVCGLWIVVFFFGWLISINIKPETLNHVWRTILDQEPGLAKTDPVYFMSEISKSCLCFLVANIVSLVGVVMMWRLNRIGFFIYVAAEIASNFFSINVEIPNEQKSYLGLIFYLAIDILFIVLYAMNLKYMKKAGVK